MSGPGRKRGLELFGFSKPKKKARVDDGNGDQPEAGDRPVAAVEEKKPAPAAKADVDAKALELRVPTVITRSFSKCVQAAPVPVEAAALSKAQLALKATFPFILFFTMGMMWSVCQVAFPQRKGPWLTSEAGWRKADGYLSNRCLEHEKTKQHKDAVHVLAKSKTIPELHLELNHAQTAGVLSRANAVSIPWVVISLLPGMMDTFRCIYWLTKERIANLKYASLRSLLKWIGVKAFDCFTSERAQYVSPIFVAAALSSIAHILSSSVETSIRHAQAFAVLIDETTDVSVFKQLIVYVRTVTHGFSQLSMIKTPARNRLSAKNLQSLMMIAIEGPPKEIFDFRAACLRWSSSGNRRIKLVF
jgi:hypothetical protein